MSGESRLIHTSTRARAEFDKRRTVVGLQTEFQPVVKASYVLQPPRDPNQNGCRRLQRALKLYEKYEWAMLMRVLSGLAGTAFALVLLCLALFYFSRRLLRRWVIGALLLLQLAVIISFFVLDGNRSAMELSRIPIKKSQELSKAKIRCKKEFNIEVSISKTAKYHFKPNMRFWEVLAIILSACICGMLASRLVYIAVARATGIDDPTNSFASTIQPVPVPRPESEIMELLTSIRVTEATSGEGLDREKQCPICLDDLNCAGSVTSMLACTHVYHEQCLGNWLRSASSPSNCPMCKAPVWADEGRSYGAGDFESPDAASSSSDSSTSDEANVVGSNIQANPATSQSADNIV